ncbi:hypothetical protein CDD81_7607 [Ophiocordyceps australis]|uniref:UDENN FLCN/SMCR8-type domain-containing protein n=1 Tax=Ophiocordyceps australis TaxID=1399860 RepID=A0A2C5Y593_9HYPO|nr:hypothetical protein CDD81_7607 [Ophiocordyceps australis]
MTYILCLAHYCDTHGPTPLMVTEGLHNPCSVCCRDGLVAAPPKLKSSDAGLRDGNNAASLPPTLPPDALVPSQRAPLRRPPPAGPGLPLDTPPESPRPMFQQARRDSGFRRTYDETVTKKQGPCENCAMTLPRRQKSAGAGAHCGADSQGPTLRTRTPIERVFGVHDEASPPNSQPSSDTDGDREPDSRSRKSMLPPSSRTTSCSSASTSSERCSYHFHYINYTSTHEPIRANSFSLVRASCLRALSFETLPRAPPASSPTTSPLLGNSPSYVTTQSPGSAATGGAIFFGDSVAGYTTAYIFRIPDLHARGHKRVYAFLALSTHKERLAMKTFAMVSAAFRDLAIWIQQLAESEAERTKEASPMGSFLHAASSSGVHQAPPPPPLPPHQQQQLESPMAADRTASSFLTGGTGFTRRTAIPGSACVPKARGLAELVGQPDFFIDLHGKFVRLLLEVGVALNA